MSEVNPPKTPHKKKRTRVLRPSQIVQKKREIYPFEGRFLDSFGTPEHHSKWFVTGPSFSGKSSFIFELCNYLSQHGTIDYNNHEESGGDALTAKNKVLQSGIEEHANIRFYKAPLISDEYETFEERLRKRASADFAILDSMQHAEMNKKMYLHYTDMFCNPRRAKSMLFISHWIKNDLTKFVKHDCDIKVEVIGFIAWVESRYGGGKPFLIWEKGARDHWGKKYHRVINGKYWPGKKS
jgi:hypothetical protein